MFNKKLLIVVLIGTYFFMPCVQPMQRSNPAYQTESDQYDQALNELEQDNSISRYDVDVIREGNWNQLLNDYQRAKAPICCMAVVIAVIAGIDYFNGTDY